MDVIDERELVERAVRALVREEPSFDDLIKRRHRKRRNQRIAAGVVGIAVFVAAVWVVTTGGAFDRTQTPAVPGGAETGPTVPPDAGWGGFGLAPEGAVPSTPETGKLIARSPSRGLPTPWLVVYADGRVIWQEDGPILERSLTPEGVDLVRSGAVEPLWLLTRSTLTADAWADADARPYVPSRNAVCYKGVRGYVEPSRAMSLLPAQAQDLLRGKERTYSSVPRFNTGATRCSELTTEEARALEQILSDAGWVGFVTPEWKEAFGDKVGDEVWFVMSCSPLLPNELSG